MTAHPFLSDAWVEQARAIKARLAGNPVDEPGLVVNATITGVPFGEPTRELHSAHGPVVGWESGHAPDAQFSFIVDYAVARELILDPGYDVLDQAITAGLLRIDGDAAALRDWWSHRIGNPDAVALDDEVRAVTA
jgi:hypothetical protein